MTPLSVLPFMTPPQASTATVTTQPAAPAPTPAPKSQFVSPPYEAYLLRQADAIRAKGGNDESVKQFYQRALARPGVRRAWVAMPDDPIENVFGDETPDNLRGLSMALIHGATLGFGDDAVASLTGMLTGEGARAGIDQYHRERDDWNRNNFKKQIVTEGVGMALAVIATRGAALPAVAARTAGLAGTAEGVGVMTKMAQAMPAGAAVGAAFGASTSHDYSFSWANVGDRTKRAIIGGTIAAPIAALGAGVGHVVGGAVRTGVSGLGTTTIVQKVADKVKDIPVLRKLHEITPDGRALELVSTFAKDRNLTADVLEQRAMGFWSQGQKPTIVDLLGDDFIPFAQQVLGKRTEAVRQVVSLLEQRQMGSGDRLIQQMLLRSLDNKKLGLENVQDAIQNLTLKGEIESAPLYSKAHQNVLKITPEVRKELLHRDADGKYPLIDNWNEAAKLANSRVEAGMDKGLIIPLLKPPPTLPANMLPTNPADRARMLSMIDADESVFPSELPVRGFDYLNRNLRAGYERARAKVGEVVHPGQTKSDETFKVLKTRVQSLVKFAEEEDDWFRQARGTYGGYRQSRDAVEQGFEDFKAALPAEDVARRLAKLQPSDRDYYRMGAAKYHNEKLRSSDAALLDVAAQQFGGALLKFDDKTGKFIGRLNGDALRVRALFPDNDRGAQDFLRVVAGEASLSKTVQGTTRLPSNVGAQKQIEANIGDLPPGRAAALPEIVGAGRQALAQERTNIAEVDKQAIAKLFKHGLEDDMGSMNPASSLPLRMLIEEIGYRQSLAPLNVGRGVRNFAAAKSAEGGTKMLRPPR